MTDKQKTNKLIKINQPTEKEFESLKFIQKHTGITTISRATVEAINAYPFLVKKIEELEKQLNQTKSSHLDTMLKIDDFIGSFEALKGVIKKPK